MLAYKLDMGANTLSQAARRSETESYHTRSILAVKKRDPIRQWIWTFVTYAFKHLKERAVPVGPYKVRRPL
jgi:hypothetical protein